MGGTEALDVISSLAWESCSSSNRVMLQVDTIFVKQQCKSSKLNKSVLMCAAIVRAKTFSSSNEESGEGKKDLLH